MDLSFLGKFAPRNLLVSVPPVLGIGGLLLSRLTGTDIGFTFPNLVQTIWSVLLGLSIPLIVFLTARVFIRLRRVLDWVFEEFSGEDNWFWILLLISGLVSFGEEVFFRGFLQPNLGLLVTSLVFSVYHLRTNIKSLVVVPATFFLGLIFSQIYLSTASIFAPVIIHFLILSGLGIAHRTFLRKK